jgi:HK97 family phage prohead protease
MIVTKSFDARVKDFPGDGPGGGEGLANAYNVLDRDNEMLMPGVFGDSLEGFVRDGFLAVGHDWKTGVGTITDAREEPEGLFFGWQWHSDPEAQVYRQRVNERQARGKSVKLSVGFSVDRWEWDEEKDVRLITKGTLYEVSIVTVPSNPLAQVTSAKNAPRVVPATAREFEEFLREVGFSRSKAEAIVAKGFRAAEEADGQGEPDAAQTDAPEGASGDDARDQRLQAELSRYFAREARLAGVSL